MKRDTILTIKLPAEGGPLEDCAVREPKSFRRPPKPFTRRALAAAHVVADPFSTREPWLEPAIDWDATIAYREHLWSWGLGIAEAMDTAQRGMGLDWPASLELIRRTLDAAKGVRMYTGDDFNFAELIEGDAEGYSDALLGIFDSIAPAASHALSALALNKRDEYHEVLAPTVPLSRHIFCAPTRFYKTGVVFMAWLNGHQDHFVMVGGQQSARHLLHFCELFRLADAAGLLSDPPLACARMKQLLAVHGCG